MVEILRQLDNINKILECIKTVETTLGNYYRESIYQSSLYVELNLNNFLVQTEVIVPVIYKNVNVGFERADIIIYTQNGEIEYILELKSQSPRLSSKEINQLRKYLNNMNCQNGILVNFYDKLEIIKVTSDSFEKIS